MDEHASDAKSPTQDAHLRLLSLIQEHPGYSQRRLAEALGVSLGKAHYLLTALFDKGLVKVDKFARSPSKLRYVYVLTPAGGSHRLQLLRRFLRLKEEEYVSLKSEIEQMRAVLDGSRSDEAGRAGDVQS